MKTKKDKNCLPKLDKISLLVLLTFLLAFFLRFYHFETIPFGLNHDGAQDALQAIELMQKPFPYRPYLTGGSGETLFKYYLAFLMKILGISAKTIRFGSVLVSFLTVPLFYFFIKNLTNRHLALFSTFLLSISGWQITMEKTVWRAIGTPLTEVLTLYFLVRAIKEQKYHFYGLTGFFLTLTLNTYNGARAFPIFIFSVLVAVVLHQVKLKATLRALLISLFVFAFTFLLTIYPLANYAKNNWLEFNSRFESLSIFKRIEQEAGLSPLFENLLKSALIFNVRANGDDFFTTQPLLDQPTSFLFLAGLAICLAKIKNKVYVFALSGLLVNLLPGFISVPNGNRNIATVPFVYLICGVGFYEIWNFLSSRFDKNAKIILLIIGTTSLIGIFNTYNLYLGANRRELWGFYPETTIVANYIKNKMDSCDFYLTDNYPRDTLTFLTYQDGDPFSKHYTWFERKESFLTVTPKNKDIIFVMFDSPENQNFVSLLKQKFPKGTTSRLGYIDDNINRSAALLYIVPKETKL